MRAYTENVGEPTISVLFRSAASLAMCCNKNREAEKLINLALSGEPPFEIAEELRDLYESVNFQRHLKLRGSELSDLEVRLVLSGNEVYPKFAKTNEIINRVADFKDLTIRNAERKAKKSFRTGAVPKDFQIFENSYLSFSEAASMAVTIKFENPKAPTIPGLSGIDEIIDDITDNILLINDNKIDLLKEKINDQKYFDNFVGLTKRLAPDGKNINLFGITSVINGIQKETPLTKNKKFISQAIIDINTKDGVITNNETEKINSIIHVEGILRVADANKNFVTINSERNTVRLLVPDGLSDIVKTYWDTAVSVDYQIEKEKKRKLLNIDKI